MKRILLTQGKFALVDDEDFDYLNQWKWHANKINNSFYAIHTTYSGQKKAIKMHRALLQPPIGLEINHIDHNSLNNKKQNLRICTRMENNMSARKLGKFTSKYKGVCWHKGKQKWVAAITINKIQKHLGGFDNEIEAARCYDENALKYLRNSQILMEFKGHHDY